MCSRRAAEALIAQGEVWVNGKAATLGQKITPGVDKVTVSGKTVRTTAQPKITVAVHKPRGLVCSNDDPHHAATVFDLLPREFSKFRFFCAGRLDLDSEGLGDSYDRWRPREPADAPVARRHEAVSRCPETRFSVDPTAATRARRDDRRRAVESGASGVDQCRREPCVDGSRRAHASRQEARDSPAVHDSWFRRKTTPALPDWRAAS